MGPEPTFAVVGAGQAGGRAVEAMHAQGFRGRVVLVGEEAYVPYERPPLSKRLLAGDDGPEGAYLHDQSYYREHGIELRLGTRVTAIDREARRIHLSDKDTIAYGKLLIATGARVRKLSLPGADLPGIRYLRDIDDSLSIRARLAANARIVVVGGGYIGLEVASVARMRGCRVTVLEMQRALMTRVVAPEIGRFYADVHREQGVEILTGVAVTGFEGAEHVEQVICSDGRAISADLVVVGVGVVPNTELAVEAGLAVDDGIVVDEFGRTTDAHIFSAGDVTNHPSPLLGRRLRLESWQNAQNQAIAVARVMCGAREPYAELPWFWSDQYDLNLQMVGLPERWDDLVWRGTADERKFTVFYLKDGVIVAANAVNNAREARLARRLIEAGKTVDPVAIADPEVPLKSFLEE